MRTFSEAKRSVSLRQGSITSINEIGLIPRMPDMTGACPLLLADLSDEMDMPVFGTETNVSAQVLHAREQALYLFSLQIGATLVCWLADPNDSEVRRMLQAWADAYYMFAALKTRSGVMVKTRLVCGIPPTIKDTYTSSSGSMDAARFIRSIVEVENSAFIKRHVQSDIASVRQIRKVRVFYVLDEAALATTTATASELLAQS